MNRGDRVARPRCGAIYELATAGRAVCDQPLGHLGDHLDSRRPICWPLDAHEQDYATGAPQR